MVLYTLDVAGEVVVQVEVVDVFGFALGAALLARTHGLPPSTHLLPQSLLLFQGRLRHGRLE